MTVTPEKGGVVVLSQDLLHEGAPVLHGTKAVLRTDVMVERRPGPRRGLTLCEDEVVDYNAAMDCFREAQRLELNQCYAEANDCYERALTLRYGHPTRVALRRLDDNAEAKVRGGGAHAKRANPNPNPNPNHRIAEYTVGLSSHINQHVRRAVGAVFALGILTIQPHHRG